MIEGTLHLTRPSRLGRVLEIQIKTCAKYGIGLEEMLGERRHKHLVRARWEAICQAYYETSFSTMRLGKLFNRDHTTILYVVGRTKTERRVKEPIGGRWGGKPAPKQTSKIQPKLIPAVGEGRV